MNDQQCLDFLQWCLPGLAMRWEGFRKVRKQVCKRIQKRINELSLPEAENYREYLQTHPAEWEVLDSLCYITVSRFYRDRKVFDHIQTTLLPELADEAGRTGKREIRIWSAGCCSGEEPYTINLIWKLDIEPGLKERINFTIIASDLNSFLLNRASAGIFRPGSLKHLPSRYLEAGFDCIEGNYKLREIFKKNINFQQQDIRVEMPVGLFHLILCRNLVFTYSDPLLQKKILRRLDQKLKGNGYLVIGAHENLPTGFTQLTPLPENRQIYRKK